MPSREYVTLVAATVTTVTLDGTVGVSKICVVNLTGTAPLYVTVGATGVPGPTVQGNDTLAVGAAAGAWRIIELSPRLDAPLVKIISSGTPDVAVEVVDDEAGDLWPYRS